ncbi:MAG: c-type cytochrome [Rhizobiales bacterium]|nr:c-type cytochrome [Hyphomicrobiales bacterium]
MSAARRYSLLLGLAASLAAALLLLPDRSKSDTIDTAQIERGRYIARLGDCRSCHTAQGGALLAGGLGIVTPFGIIYSANITPDVATGIGSWTKDDFWNAMHSGIRKDGAHLYPAMPYPWFTKMPRTDVDALKTYLDTIPPARYTPPENDLWLPLRARVSVAGWNLLFFDKGVFKTDPAKSAEWNRGAYIVEGPGHCGACHTPANLLGGPERDRLYEGQSIQNWWAPNLTGRSAYGVATWSKEDVVDYLKDGRNDHAVASGPMALAIQNSTQHMTDADRAAIAAYLKDPPVGTREEGDSPRVSEAGIDSMGGKAIFRDNCSACHGADGEGVPRLIADLRKSGVVNAPDPVGVLHAILAGAQGNVTHGAPQRPTMPPFAWKFDDRQIAAVAAYVRQNFGNHAPSVSDSEVADLRETLGLE